MNVEPTSQLAKGTTQNEASSVTPVTSQPSHGTMMRETVTEKPVRRPPADAYDDEKYPEVEVTREELEKLYDSLEAVERWGKFIDIHKDEDRLWDFNRNCWVYYAG